MPQNSLIHWFCRLYVVMLYAYPREFRMQFGGEMQQLFRDRCRQAPIVDNSATARIGAEADVFRNGKMRREAQLLLHHGDAERMRLLWREGSDWAPVDKDLTTVGPQRSRQQVD